MGNCKESSILMELSNRMADAVDKAAASVVLVNARARYPSSGVSIASDRVLTANHTVERGEGIKVFMSGGAETEARLVGRDPGTDLALLRLDRPGALPAEPSPDEARIGQLVLAVGRPNPEGIEASQGVVSARGGPAQIGPNAMLDRYLRTDAIPYPGFSGGPLVDVNGLVLGVNTTGLASGAPLTIPVDLAWKVAEAIDRGGRVTRGFLGIRTQPVEIPAALQTRLGREQVSGLMIVSVDAGSPAAMGGLLLGDILVAAGDQPIEDHAGLIGVLGVDTAGEILPFHILRGGEVRTLPIQVGKR